jgi:DnaJ-class molecular chaperone
MQLPNYYKILELDKKATEEQIWLSYHKLLYLFKKNNLIATQKHEKLEEAYFVLSHEETKKKYDKYFEYENFLGLSSHARRSLVVFFTSFFSILLVLLLLESPKF